MGTFPEGRFRGYHPGTQLLFSWRICRVGGIRNGTDQVVSDRQVHAVLAGCRLDQSIISISISVAGEACGVPDD